MGNKEASCPFRVQIVLGSYVPLAISSASFTSEANPEMRAECAGLPCRVSLTQTLTFEHLEGEKMEDTIDKLLTRGTTR